MNLCARDFRGLSMLDILRSNETLWKIFVNHEDYAPAKTDEHGRINYKDTQRREIADPVVSRHLFEQGLRVKYPGDKSFAVCLSHDIDLINYSFLKPLLRRPGTRRTLRWLDRQFNPRWNFRDIVDLEKRFGAKSTFFFMALNPGEKDFNYHIDDLADELRWLSDEGCGIGLHGGYEAWDDLGLMKRQKEAVEKALGAPILGYRNHYMRIKVPATWHLLEQAGFVYDTTYGYPDQAGYRNGMCHPFRPYDMTSNSFLSILEIPLVIMDGSLFTYMGLSPSEALATARNVIDAASRCNGVVSILWHNTHVAKKTPRRIYADLLSYCSSKGAWLTSPDEMCRWWLENDPLRQGKKV